MSTEGGTPAAGEGAGAGAGGAPGGTPAAGGAAAGVAPAAGATATAAAPAAGAPGKGKGGAQKPPPFDAHPGFRKRVDQEAARVIKKQLGCSIEEAQALIARARASSEGGAPAAGGAAAAPAAGGGGNELAAQVAKLTARVGKLTARVETQKGKLQRRQRQHRMEMVEQEIKHELLANGISAKAVDYVVGLFRQANAGKEAAEIVTVPAYVASLRKEQPFVFAKPGEVPAVLDPTTAAPESRQPGEETPNPNASGARPAVVDVTKMSDQEFQSYKKSRYGV